MYQTCNISRGLQQLFSYPKMEVVHRYQGFYPFGKNKQFQNTYLIVLKHNLSQLQLNTLKNKYKYLKDNLTDNFIKISRILRQQNSLHIIFEYYYDSIQMYLDKLKQQTQDKFDQTLHKNIITKFETNIDDIIYHLIKLQIKTQMLINNIACFCLNHQDKHGEFVLKIFIEPQSEYFTASQTNSQKGKDNSSLKNKQNLQYYYFAEKKRLFMEFQELIEKKFGKQQNFNEKVNNPNFVINGTKLIFTKPQPQKQVQVKQQAELQRRSTQENKMTPLNFKQKFQKRIEEIKKVNAGIEQKHFNNKQPIIKTINPQVSQSSQVPQPPLNNQKIEYIEQIRYNDNKGMKIVNFDQSFQPQFKPEQFTKENTFLLQENQYLDQLQNQIINLNNSKKADPSPPQPRRQQPQTIPPLKKPQNKPIESPNTNPNPNSYSNTITSSNTNNSNTTTTASTKLKTEIEQNRSTQHNKQLQKSNKSASSINNSNLSANNTSQDKGVVKQNNLVVKAEKVNKYKMKIITSHEIQIENGGEQEPNFQEIEKQILENIRSGKINLSDLANNPKANFISKQISSIEERKEPEKQRQRYKEKQKQQQKQRQRQKQRQKEKQKQRQRQVLAEPAAQLKNRQPIKQIKQPQKLLPTSPQINNSSTKSINEIMQKISKKNPPKRVEHNQIDTDTTDNPTIPPVLPSEKINETQTKHNVNIHANKSPNNNNKPEKIEIMEERPEKSENYLMKIREAKLKAQNVLKEYTKKKQ